MIESLTLTHLTDFWAKNVGSPALWCDMVARFIQSDMLKSFSIIKNGRDLCVRQSLGQPSQSWENQQNQWQQFSEQLLKERVWLDTFACVSDYCWLFLLVPRLRQMSFFLVLIHTEDASEFHCFRVPEDRFNSGEWLKMFFLYDGQDHQSFFLVIFECMRIQFSGNSLYKGPANAVNNPLVTQYTVNQ